jgi:glycosyltransferase involved in cell wall biosynthesis
MKITYIVPGFGGTFYCGNCLRDSAFSKSLKALGHDSITLPLYLPHSIEEFAHQTDIPVFYGAVNIYLKQNFKMFRNMPSWLYHFFNSPVLLKYAAKKSGSTRAEGLEEMTISMLNGVDGFQKVELDQLIHFLKHHEKPDVVHLSNALLMGLVAKIKEELNVPVFCTLQDEDVWINAMREHYKPRLWDLMSEKAKDVDAFIAVSHFFKNEIQRNMNIPENKIHVIHLGVNPDAYSVQNPLQNQPAIGYLSRMNEDNGLGILTDAFLILKQMPEFKTLKLVVTGGKTDDDKPFLNRQIKKLKKAKFINDVEFIDDFRTTALDQFFNKITVLSVPVLHGEAFGLYQLEALASGIPIVQPALGAFPEIAEATKAGTIFNPNTADALAEKLVNVLSDKESLKQMSINGRQAVENTFNSKNSTEKLAKIYQDVINSKYAEQKCL